MAVTETLRCQRCDAAYEREASEHGNLFSEWYKPTDGNGGTCPIFAARGNAA